MTRTYYRTSALWTSATRRWSSPSHGNSALDILVHNAAHQQGRQRPALLEEAEWDRTLDVNLKGAFLGAALHAIPAHSGVAAAVAFLASEEASIITGATLPVDGDLGIQSTAALLKPSLRAGWRQGRLDLVELE